MAKKKKDLGEGANWMDTYGDMVTLLLCFFVLLYSISSVDTVKWEILVRSFNPNADELSQIVVNTKEDVTGENDVEGSAEPNMEITNFEDLYYTLSEYAAENNLEEDMQVSQGDNFVFITFRNNIFFDGDSYVLKTEGKAVLDNLATAIGSINDDVGEVRVLGHTSQAEPNKINELYSDRFLSSDRATIVVSYIQEKDVIDPYKLVSCGYGQFRPISSFETRESRAKNRRVEILITKNGAVEDSLTKYYQSIGETQPDLTGQPDAQTAPQDTQAAPNTIE